MILKCKICYLRIFKKAQFKGILEFHGRDRKNSVASKSKSKIEMKNLPENILFFTDGYFDFDVGLWKSGGRNIRNVCD